MEAFVSRINPRDLGFFAWNPPPDVLGNDRINGPMCTVNREIIDRMLDLNGKPPRILNIPQLNSDLNERRVQLGGGRAQKVNWNIYPFAYSSFVPLTVAQERGCQLSKIDFHFTGSVLRFLFERKTCPGKTYLLHIKKGIIIIQNLTTYISDLSDAGYAFERFMTGNLENGVDFKTVNHLRQITIGLFDILITAEVDGIDDNENIVEIKTSARNNEVWIQMLANGSNTLINLKKKQSRKDKNGKYILEAEYINKIDLEELMPNPSAQEQFLDNVINSLSQIMQQVQGGHIVERRDNFFMYYEISFDNNNSEILVKPYNNLTVEKCSQDLYNDFVLKANNKKATKKRKAKKQE